MMKRLFFPGVLYLDLCKISTEKMKYCLIKVLGQGWVSRQVIFFLFLFVNCVCWECVLGVCVCVCWECVCVCVCWECVSVCPGSEWALISAERPHGVPKSPQNMVGKINLVKASGLNMARAGAGLGSDVTTSLLPQLTNLCALIG